VRISTLLAGCFGPLALGIANPFPTLLQRRDRSTEHGRGHGLTRAKLGDPSIIILPTDKAGLRRRRTEQVPAEAAAELTGMAQSRRPVFVPGAIGKPRTTPTEEVRALHVEMVPPSTTARTLEKYLLSTKVSRLPVEQHGHLVLAVDSEHYAGPLGAHGDDVICHPPVRQGPADEAATMVELVDAHTGAAFDQAAGASIGSA
jgi:hypothetical protein